jgi:hypothetical protein
MLSEAVNRWVWTFIIVVIVLLLLACVGYFTGNWNEDEAARPGYQVAAAESQMVDLGPCMDEATRERMRAVMLEALDDALKEHVKRVFEVWLRDERGQPDRARTGVRQGIKAWLGAHRGALEWMPPTCPG